ncbi:MAG: PQQ-like beta-propeller repeat protein [Lentisphaeraceae bacterium]|nr:PQQ-like beta-propeller repeat protein [Lentisphaeraceae bacterium]
MKAFIILLLTSLSIFAQNWPQASGPTLNYQTSGTAPLNWSVSQNENILWKVTLPEGGQSTPVIWGDKLFLTMNKAVEKDCTTNDTIIAMCFSTTDGTLIWQKELKGHWAMRMNAVFSDATVCSPLTDGKTVLFTSPSGIIAAFDFEGNEKWRYTWPEGGGYNIRQHEPFMIDEKAFVLIERDETFKKPENATSHKYWGRRKFIRCLNLDDGKTVWDAECDSSPHYTSMPAKTADGNYAIMSARGGGHMPPELKHGFSLISCENGKELLYNKDQVTTIQNLLFDSKYIYNLNGSGLKMYDSKSGSLLKSIDIYKNSLVTQFDGSFKTSQTNFSEIAKGKKKKKTKGLTEFTNIIVGDYLFFLSDKPGFVGRINLTSGLSEYLQVPLHLEGDKRNWEKHIPSDVKNSRGFDVKGDARSSGSGYGHLGASPPIVVGEYIYFPVMPGIVHVIKWNADKLDGNALVSVNDLGEAGKTWTLAGFAYSNGKLYTRTLKELICIGK